MQRKLLNFLNNPTSKNITINTIGNYLNVFFTVFLVLLLTRIWDPATYGVFSVLFGIAYVLANVLDFGVTATIYSYLPPMLEKQSGRQGLYKFVKSTFYYQTIFSMIVIAILFVSFPYLDKVFFKTGAPVWQLYLTAFSVLFFIWQNFASNCLFASKNFMSANIYLNITNVIKTIMIVFLAAIGQVNVGWVLLIYGIIGPIIFFALLFFEKRDIVQVIIHAPIDRKEFRFRYTLVFFIANQFLNLGMRMDLFLLSYFQLKQEVGYYAIAQKIILTIITTIISITQVLSPSFSKPMNKKEIMEQFKHSLTYLALPSGLFFALFLTPDFLFNFSFTQKFVNSAPISRALALPFIIYALSNIPMLFLLYTVKKPKYILAANMAFFFIFSGMCYYLIPIFQSQGGRGVYAPVYAAAVAFTVNGLILLFSAMYEYKKLPFNFNKR